MITPKLRFASFKKSWESSKLELAIASIQSGKSKDREINGQFPLFGSTGVIGYTNKPEYSGKSILIARVGANAGSKYVVDGEYSVTDNTLILRLKEGCSYQFFSDLLEHKKLNKLTFGSGQPLVTGGLLKQLEVNYPEENEQQKVASFLSKIDQKISLLTKKHELFAQYKKGVMQKIFNREIRFKDKNGNNFPDSKRVFLGDIAQFYKGKGISKSDISSDGLTPCIRYGELYTQYGVTISEVISKTNTPIKDLILSKANDVIIPASGETQIDIATASCVIHGGIALGGDLNIIRTEQSGVFLCYYLNSEKKLDIAKLAQGNSVVHLYASQLKGLEIDLPTLAEQELIANFLSLIDKKIALCNAELIATKKYKQGLLQQMFI